MRAELKSYSFVTANTNGLGSCSGRKWHSHEQPSLLPNGHSEEVFLAQITSKRHHRKCYFYYFKRIICSPIHQSNRELEAAWPVSEKSLMLHLHAPVCLPPPAPTRRLGQWCGASCDHSSGRMTTLSAPLTANGLTQEAAEALWANAQAALTLPLTSHSSPV